MKIDYTLKLCPRIYVVSLNGKTGEVMEAKWIEATQTRQFVVDEIRELLGRSEIDDRGGWEIHDVEDFGTVEVLEKADLDTVLRAANLIAERGHLAAEIISALGSINHIGIAERALREYVGTYSSLESYVRSLIDGAYERTSPWFPADWRGFVNVEALTREIFPDGDGTGSITTLKCGEVYHIFDCQI